MLSRIKKFFQIFQNLEHQSDNKQEETMKYLVVGLGNMDIDYDGTRHNIGFEIVDTLVNKYEANVQHEKLGDLSNIKYRGRSIYLLKPSTYMNRSGKAVRYWMEKLNVEKDKLLIVVDDLNLDFGKVRIRAKGSDGGHNGLKDIQQYIGTDYARIRIGIGDSFHKGQQVDYVLGKWDENEQKELPNILTKVSEAVLSFSFHGLQTTMNQFNS
jgi:PTH1 family peptidyl-tRNA hydrolase